MKEIECQNHAKLQKEKTNRERVGKLLKNPERKDKNRERVTKTR